MTNAAPTIAATIAQQLGGMNRIAAMTGARDFIDMGNGLKFKVSGGRWVTVTLGSDDLYAVTVHKMNRRTFEVAILGEAAMVYADSLRRTVESLTGLYLSL